MADDDTQRILAAVDRLDSKVDRLETKQDTMRGDIMDRIDRLQHTVDETRDEVAVNFGNTHRVERAARAAIDDGRITMDILRAMQRQIARLQTDMAQMRGSR
jgi:hypothetical protein